MNGLLHRLHTLSGWEVRRPGHPLYCRTIQVSKVHLVYEAKGIGGWRALIKEVCTQTRVEVHFE